MRLGYRSDGSPVELSVGPRTKKLALKKKDSLASVDLSELCQTPLLEELTLIALEAPTLDLTPLAALKNLRSIRVEAWNLELVDLSPLRSLSALESLDFLTGKSDRLRADVTPLAELPRVRSLLVQGGMEFDALRDPTTIRSKYMREQREASSYIKRGLPAEILRELRLSFLVTDETSEQLLGRIDTKQRALLEDLYVPVPAVRVRYEDFGVNDPPVAIHVAADHPRGVPALTMLVATQNGIRTFLERAPTRCYFEGFTRMNVSRSHRFTDPPVYELELGS